MKRKLNFGWPDLILGILLIVLGIYTFANPGTAITGVVIIYGLLAIVTGIVDIVFYVRLERHAGLGPTVSLVSGIFSILAGILALIFPGAGKWVLTVFFTIWFIAHCISRLANLDIARIMAGKAVFYFSLVVNILGLLLGFILLFNPWATAISFGYIIGVYLILLGVGSIVTAFTNAGTPS